METKQVTKLQSIIQEMKQKVQDHCEDIQKNPKVLEEIKATAVQVSIPRWLGEAQDLNFEMVVHNNDKGVASAGKPPAGHIGQIVNQVAKNIQDEKSKGKTNVAMLDIGVNYGWASFTSASVGAKVYSFEPMQSNVKFLRTALCLSPPEMRERVTLFDFGLSNRAQNCVIASHDGNIGDGQVYCAKEGETSVTPPGGQKIRETVALRRLDDVFVVESPADEELLKEIVVVKMDTEAHEPMVVEGARSFFRKFLIPVIHSEFNNREMSKVNSDAEGMMRFFFEELGYDVQENRPHHIGRLGRAPLSREVAMNMNTFNGLHDLIFSNPTGKRTDRM